MVESKHPLLSFLTKPIYENQKDKKSYNYKLYYIVSYTTLALRPLYIFVKIVDFESITEMKRMRNGSDGVKFSLIFLYYFSAPYSEFSMYNFSLFNLQKISIYSNTY